MTLTSLGGVSNSGGRHFTNPVGTIAMVNYGRVTGSENYFPVAYNCCPKKHYKPKQEKNDCHEKKDKHDCHDCNKKKHDKKEKCHKKEKKEKKHGCGC